MSSRKLATKPPRRALGYLLIFLPLAGLMLLPIINLLFDIERRIPPPVAFTLILTLLTLPFVGAAILWRAGMAPARERDRLLTGGRAGTATVRAARMGGSKQTVGGVDERWLIVLDLTVTPEGGSPYEATAEYFVPLLDIPKVQPGCELQVRIDPGDETKVAVI